MQKSSLSRFRLTTLLWKTEKLEIVLSFDNFIFISLKLWGEKYGPYSYSVRGVIDGVQIMIQGCF